MKELLRAIKFALISASAGLIQIATFTVLNEFLHLPYWVSYLIALVLSVIWNFTLNRKYTFKLYNILVFNFLAFSSTVFFLHLPKRFLILSLRALCS